MKCIVVFKCLCMNEFSVCLKGKLLTSVIQSPGARRNWNRLASYLQERGLDCKATPSFIRSPKIGALSEFWRAVIWHESFLVPFSHITTAPRTHTENWVIIPPPPPPSWVSTPSLLQVVGVLIAVSEWSAVLCYRMVINWRPIAFLQLKKKKMICKR